MSEQWDPRFDERSFNKLNEKAVPPSWTDEEENRVVRKLDMYLLPWMCVCYTSLLVDRGNISTAYIINRETPSHTMVNQLGLTGSQPNWAISAFYFGFVLFEIPSNLLITKFNPSRWIARIMTSWGIAATCMAAVNNFPSLVAVRVIIGIMEAGFGPGMMLYLAFWYKKYQVSGRWATMYAGGLLLSNFGILISYGVAFMDGRGGLPGWRWLFIIEGAASVLIGIATAFILPDYPQTCKFLNDREKEIVIGRLPPTGPTMHAKDMKLGEILDAFTDWTMYAFALSLVLLLTTVSALSSFQPTIINQMGFVSTTAQLMGIPTSLATTFFVVTSNWSSDYQQEKAIHGVVVLVPPIIGYFLLATIQPSLSPGGRYGLLFLLMSSSSFIPLVSGFATISTKGASRAAVRSAFTLAIGNIGAAAGAQVYQSDDAPLYVRGHFINAGFVIGALCVYLVTVWIVTKRGEYTGPKANLMVIEHGGVELGDSQFLSFEQVVPKS
ncbi:MFS general substrate transporter [Gonapodya prolifera JEL478]|uniref:MFS general substrate transporter n=1 Tax=Gonapodya prolifera (strain JEL478) TaxID=1344416 RepID=A0A139A6C8_GONPJ|nr:MFS general substrate transporter [Gonapodya prolifera JEL478]|eukprot:KXS12347.1 MFS general substrate transporter [Gonapodya prolifera JEL478]